MFLSINTDSSTTNSSLFIIYYNFFIYLIIIIFHISKLLKGRFMSNVGSNPHQIYLRLPLLFYFMLIIYLIINYSLFFIIFSDLHISLNSQFSVSTFSWYLRISWRSNQAYSRVSSKILNPIIVFHLLNFENLLMWYSRPLEIVKFRAFERRSPFFVQTLWKSHKS